MSGRTFHVAESLVDVNVCCQLFCEENIAFVVKNVVIIQTIQNNRSPLTVVSALVSL